MLKVKADMNYKINLKWSISKKYPLSACKHGEFTEKLFAAVGPHSDDDSYIAKKKHGNPASTKEESLYLITPDEKINSSATLKFVANCFYDLLRLESYPPPKTKLLNMSYTKSNELLPSAIEDINGNRPSTGLHILSKRFKGYCDISNAKVKHNDSFLTFKEYVTSKQSIPETIWHEGEELKLTGLIEILAIGKLLHDIDIMGRSFSNVGFVIENDLHGNKVACAVRVGLGLAFNDSKQNMFLAKRLDGLDSRNIQINEDGDIINWNNLTPDQQHEFMFKLGYGIMVLQDDGLLKYMLFRDGAFNEKFGPRLKKEDIKNLIKTLKKNLDQQKDTYEMDTQPWKYQQEFGGDSVYWGELKDGKKDGKGVLIDYRHKYYCEFKGDQINGKGVLTYPGGNRYYGEFKNYDRDGNGVCKYVNGDRYDGEWKDGKKNGNGVFTAANGNKYDGDWENDNMHGKGVYIWANGNKYDGDWENDNMHGKGVYIWADGEKYDGDWVNGIMYGEGVYTEPNGDKYEGYYEHGMRHGYGVFTAANGDIYKGNWKNGKKCGKGVYTYINGDIYDGYWENDNKHGYGLFTAANGNDTYDGDWENGKKHGFGMDTEAGNKYVGFWQDGKKHGHGQFKAANNDIYTGNWEGGNKHGYGEYTWAAHPMTGDKYVGDWKNDNLHGYGEYTYANGRKYKGEWVNGNGPSGGCILS